MYGQRGLFLRFSVVLLPGDVANMPETIDIPGKLQAPSAAEFLQALQATTADEVVLNFRPLTFAQPAGVMTSAMGIRAWARGLRNTGRTFRCEYEAIEPSAQHYLENLGYFAFVQDGYSGINRPGNRGQFLPLTRILREDLEPRDGESMQDRIEERSEELAQVLCDADVSDEAVQQLRYCFRELIRNAFEHARVEAVYLMAQRYAKANEAEIAIGDLGCGIHATLREARNLPDARDAILAALQPGISRFTEHNRGEHGNSGYGLWVTSEFCRLEGRFHLATSNELLSIHDHHTSFTPIPLQSTVVSVRLNTLRARGWATTLDTIIARGEAIAAQNGGLSASSASKRVRL